MRRLAFTLGATLLAARALAVDVQRVEVTHADTRYQVLMRVTLDARAQDSWTVFSDPLRLPQINPAVREVRLLDAARADAPRVYTKVAVCVSLYCRELEQVQDMQFLRSDVGGTVRADVLPDVSDFRYGRASWVFSDCGGRTCLAFDAELEPAFWVPPLIGPWLIQRKLREEAIQTSEGLERLARALQAAP